jgi:hypothetical protein
MQTWFNKHKSMNAIQHIKIRHNHVIGEGVAQVLECLLASTRLRVQHPVPPKNKNKTKEKTLHDHLIAAEKAFSKIQHSLMIKALIRTGGWLKQQSACFASASSASSKS